MPAQRSGGVPTISLTLAGKNGNLIFKFYDHSIYEQGIAGGLSWRWHSQGAANDPLYLIVFSSVE
jgi:hypothetical protein